MKLQFQTILKFEVDTDTGKNRVLQSFTRQVGEGTQNTYKKKPKEATETTISESKEY